MYDWGYGMGENNAGSWLIMLLMMVLVFLGVVLAVKYLGREWHTGIQCETAMDVLKKRYAKGEIDKKEFEYKRKDLK